MHPSLAVAALVSFLVVALPAEAVTIVLDPMTDPLPPNPCLPVSMQPVVFTGLFCDGASCPPGALVGPSCWSQHTTEQISLPGVGPTIARSIYLSSGYAPPDEIHSGNARINAELQRLEVVAPADGSALNISLRYNGDYGWNLSPAAMGATELRIRVDGDMSSARPLSCYVLLEDMGDGSEESNEYFATLTVEATAPGELVLPFSEFTTDPPFDLNGLDWINVSFFGCSSVCESNSAMPSFTAGPIRFETGAPVAAKKRSWGQLKTGYR
jgi:hypothetical protein